MSVVDAAMTREMLREIGKHPVDIGDLQVHVTHGVVYLSGRIGKIRGYHHDIDLHEELRIILTALRSKPGVRDVVCDVELDGLSLEERAKLPRRVKHGAA